MIVSRRPGIQKRNVVTWRYSYSTSEGNIASIAELAIVDNRTTPTAALCHALFAASFTKTSSDTLKIFVNHTFTGTASYIQQETPTSWPTTGRSERDPRRASGCITARTELAGEARADLFCYVEAFYNRCRFHSALDYLIPNAYELLYRQSAGLS